MTESHGIKLKEVLVRELELAKSNIKIAMAYFMDPEVSEIIKEKAKNGVTVEFVLGNHSMNNKVVGEMNSSYVDIYLFAYNPNHSFYTHKFCIIDGRTLFYGERFWTYAATFNEHDSDLVLNGEKELLANYMQKFNELKKHCNSKQIIYFTDPRSASWAF